MESSRTRPWPRECESSRTSLVLALVSKGKSLAVALRWKVPEISKACINNKTYQCCRLKNFSKVTMNESIQVPKFGDNLFWGHIVRSYLLTKYRFCVLGRPLDGQGPWYLCPWHHHRYTNYTSGSVDDTLKFVCCRPGRVNQWTVTVVQASEN